MDFLLSLDELLSFLLQNFILRPFVLVQILIDVVDLTLNDFELFLARVDDLVELLLQCVHLLLELVQLSHLSFFNVRLQPRIHKHKHTFIRKAKQNSKESLHGSH